MIRALAVVVALLLAAKAWTQELAPTPTPGARVDGVVVEGAPDETTLESVRALFGVVPGDPYDLSSIRLGIKRVFLTGPWADVRVYADVHALADGTDAVTLHVRLVPDRIVSDVVVKAPRGVPTDRLERIVGLEAGDRFREDKLDAAVAALTAALADLGYPRGAVTVDVDATGPATRRLVFRIAPGDPVLVAKLSIEGEPALSARELEGLLGVDVGEPFDRLRLEAGLQKVVELLARRRRLGAQASIEAVRTDATRSSAEVVVRVDAGPLYAVRFVGNAYINDAALRLILPDKKIGSSDEASLVRAAQTIEGEYEERGFYDVGVEVEDVAAEPPYDRFAARELRFMIVEGPRAEVGDIIVEGAVQKDAGELADAVRAWLVDAAPEEGPLQLVEDESLVELLAPARAPLGGDDAVDVADAADAAVDDGAQRFPRPLFGSRLPYRYDDLVEAGARIADVYRNDGFLDAKVEGPRIDLLDEGRVARARFVVVEGRQALISGVRFVVPSAECSDGVLGCGQSAIPEPDLLASVALAPGQPASMSAIADARTVLERNLQERGHPFARVSESVERAPGAEFADVVYQVSAGPKVTVGSVRVEGNAVTSEAVILDRVVLREGELYRASDVEDSRQRLLRMGLFSNVSIDLLDDRADATVRDVLVKVRERPRFSVEVGAGASVEDGPRTFVAGEVRNLLGLGFGLKGRAQINYPRVFYGLLYDADDPNNPEHRFDAEPNPWLRSLYFFEGEVQGTAEVPKLYGMPFDTRLHLDGVGLREIRPAFTLNRGSILLGAEVPGLSWLRLAPQVEAEASDFDCPKDLTFGQSCGEGSIGLTRRRDAGFLRQGTVRLISTLDFRDNPVRPHAGLLTSLTTELAVGSGELRRTGDATESQVDSDFVKVTALVNAYVPLAPNFTWALAVRAGNIFPISQDSYIPLFKRFYLGGTQSIRGWREDELLPADDALWPGDVRLPPGGLTAGTQRASLGGDFYALARSELRILVVGDLETAFFVDAGELLEDPLAFDARFLAVGAGFGVRYNTPVGPFVVDLGWKVIDGGRQLPSLIDPARANLHLSIGSF